MHKLFLILKGILLYSFILVFILFIIGIDSISTSNYCLLWASVIVILAALCYRFISFEDLKKLSLMDWIDKITKN